MFYEKPNMELLLEEDNDVITTSSLFDAGGDDEVGEDDGYWSDWW